MTRYSKTAVIYARVSPKPTADDASVDRQVAECRKRAKSKGYRVLRVYEDRLLSAYDDERKPRPAFEKLLRELDDVDVVLCWEDDRFIRNSRSLERIAPILAAANVVVEALAGAIYDLDSADGIFNARIAGAIATRENARKAERLRIKHAALRDEGKSAGGARAFGFRKGNALVDPDEAKVVVELVDRVLSGDSLVSIADDLNARGVKTARGKTGWTATTLRWLLGNPRIAGIRTTTDRNRDGTRGPRREVGPAAWDTIVPVEKFRRVEAVLDGRKRLGGQGRTPRLLTGLLVCGKCGAKLVASKRAPVHGSHRVYICNRRSGFERGASRTRSSRSGRRRSSSPR